MMPLENDKTESLVRPARSNECEWELLPEPGISGIHVKILRFDTHSGRAPTFLSTFAAGASYPAHDHPAGEEVFVLAGEVYFSKYRLSAGDYLYTPRLSPLATVASIHYDDPRVAGTAEK